MLSTYYCWRPVYDGYEYLQLLEQNGGFGNNGAQLPTQIHNVHNNAGTVDPSSLFGVGCIRKRKKPDPHRAIVGAEMSVLVLAHRIYSITPSFEA